MTIFGYLLTAAVVILACGLVATVLSLRKLKGRCGYFASAVAVEARLNSEKMQREWLSDRIDKVSTKAGAALTYLGYDPEHGYALPDAVDARSPEQKIAERFEHKDYAGAVEMVKQMLAPKTAACSGGAGKAANSVTADFVHYMNGGAGDGICESLGLTKPGKHAVVINVTGEAE